MITDDLLTRTECAAAKAHSSGFYNTAKALDNIANSLLSLNEENDVNYKALLENFAVQNHPKG